MATPVTQTINQLATPVVQAPPPISGFTTIFGVTVNPSVVVLALLLCGVGYILWQGQRDSGQNTFDVWDLVMDRSPNGNRVASGIKCLFQGSFILSSWVIVDQEIKGSLSETVFGVYMATWCGSLIAKVVFDKQDPPKLPLGNKGDADHC